MSTQMDYSPELDSEAIRVRLRRHMGEYKISRSKLSIATGINRASLATKLDGPVEFTVPEISAVAKALDKSWIWVMTGQDIEINPDGGGDDDGTAGAPTRARTWDLRIKRAQDGPEDAEILELRPHAPAYEPMPLRRAS